MIFHRLVFAFFILLFTSFCLSAKNIDHWESVVLNTSASKYFRGTSEPFTSWNTLNYNDDGWLNGQCAIGYGDDDDLTEIDLVQSVYMRTKFNITDLSSIENMALSMDYDDAFVAYLNGVEIARSNIGSAGDRPAYNQQATSNHEALLYQGKTPELYNLVDVFKSALREGENVLAIQVHNVVANSSDMTCMPFLSVGLSTTDQIYMSTPNWFEAPYQEEVFESSNLPILIIDTEGGAAIVDEPKVKATLKVAYNANGERNYVDGPYDETSGPIGIEIRGNVTQGFPKKPYIFETRDSLGENRNVKLLGLPKENDWILRAVYLDKTLMRNAVAMHMSQSMGRYASRYRFCEVILNGQYDGVYMLMEKIKRDKNRVDVAELFPTMNDGDSITGGYIYQVSQDAADFGERRSLSYPAADEITPAQLNYIQNYDNEFRAVMKTTAYNHPQNGYPKYIDVQSFIDEIIVQETCKNSDAYGWSSYFYKDRLRKLCAGPVWDFDQALANSTWNNGGNAREWIINKSSDSVPTFWARLFNDPNFKYLFKKRWFELRETVLHTDTLMKFIDTNAILLNEGQRRNFDRWKILGGELWRSLPGYAERDTYQKEVDYMKQFLREHLAWMDAELSTVPNRNIELPSLVMSEIMYAPYDGDEQEYLKITNNSNAAVDLTGVFFSKGIHFSFEDSKILSANSSIVIAADLATYASKHESDANAQFSGQLDNKGEKLEIVNGYGMVIDQLAYTDSLPWPAVDHSHFGPIVLNDYSVDNSQGENWSFKQPDVSLPRLMISEIMYNPIEGSGYEFIELYNAEESSIDLAGYYFSDGMEFHFSEGQSIEPGAYLVLASNQLWVSNKYSIQVAGEFTGKLDNNGETVTLRDAAGNIVDMLKYNDKAPWPLLPETLTQSIELVNAESDNSLGENWAASFLDGGTPGYKYYNSKSDFIGNMSFEMYPNPANNEVFVKLNPSNNLPVEITIYNLAGVKMWYAELRNSKDVRINLSQFKSGSYIVRCNSVKFTKIKHLSVIR